MNKLTYYINIQSENPCDFDPNLDFAVKDIIRRKRGETTPDSFDFEIIGLFDGFILNSKFNACLNAFLRDMISGPDPYFTSRKEGKLNDYVEYVKLFIAHFNDPDRDIKIFNAGNYMHMHSLDVFKEFEREGKHMALSVHIFIPVMENDTIKYKLQYGPDYLIMVLSIEEMFKYFMALIYRKLYDLDLLYNAELKRIATYRIGFH